MNSKDIQKQLKENSINYSMIAEAVGVSPAHVRNVAERIFVSRRVAIAIATAINLPLYEVFPDYKNKVAKVKKEARKKTVSRLKKQISKIA